MKSIAAGAYRTRAGALFLLITLVLTGCALYTSVAPCIMCAYAIRLARISLVVCGARGGDAPHVVSGHLVLTDERAAPNRPPPLVIRDVLAQECERVRDQHRA